MNKVILMGRLTRDAEVRYNADIAIARFTLAVDRRFSKNNEADFISCVAFGNTATFIERFGTKGVKFIIEGRIQTGSYKNKEGQNIYTTDVVVDSVEFAESKGKQETPEFPYKCPSLEQSNGFINIPEGIEEELPFK